VTENEQLTLEAILSNQPNAVKLIEFLVALVRDLQDRVTVLEGERK
jgi:hypothetical protein